MKVSGFTLVRNAMLYDYPIVEAIQSILPLCDEVVVAVGKSDDETLALIQNIPSDKVRIIETVWDDALRKGGKVLAAETNKAKAAISPDADWAFYIQGDEILHESFIPVIRSGMEQWLNDKRVEGLLFHYRHFYGSYDFIGDSPRWYPKEVRIIRNDTAIYSFRDAQGFRKASRPLRVKQLAAFIYHYGWVKDPRHQQAKQKTFNKLWHDDDWVDKNVSKLDEFDYSNVDALKRFDGTHPQVMQKRVEQMNWKFSFDPALRRLPAKQRFKKWVKDKTGWAIGEYQNYRII